ncbi:MAG TPA: GAF domain-containing protein, partial [Patescibacteria group bacterium]
LIFQIRQKVIKEGVLETAILENSAKLEKISGFNKRILDNVPVSILTMDKNGRIISANRYADILSGSPGKNKIGKNIFDFNLVKDNELEEDYHRLLREGASFDKQDCIYQSESLTESKYLNILAVPLKNTAGEVEGAISMAVDNSKIVTSELKTKQKAEQLFLLNQISLAINSVLDLKEVLWVILRNAAILTSAYQAELFLVEDEQLVLKEIYSLKYFYNKNQQPKINFRLQFGQSIVGYVAQTKQPYLSSDVRIDPKFDKDNNDLEINSVLAIPIFSQKKEDQLKGVLRVCSDRPNHFTEDDQEILTILANNASVAIANSELYNKVKSLKKFSDDIIDSSSLAIVVTNQQGQIIRHNNAAAQFIKDLKLAQNDIFYVENYFNIIEIIKKIQQTKESFCLDNLIFPRDEKDYYYNIKIDPILLDDQLSSVIITIDDVTKKVKLEQEIRDLNRNLEEKVALRTSELNLVNQKLEEAIKLKNRFIADASHELRTPLTIIKGHLDLIRHTKEYSS